jgi:hypothetical protein
MKHSEIRIEQTNSKYKQLFVKYASLFINHPLLHLLSDLLALFKLEVNYKRKRLLILYCKICTTLINLVFEILISPRLLAT